MGFSFPSSWHWHIRKTHRNPRERIHVPSLEAIKTTSILILAGVAVATAVSLSPGTSVQAEDKPSINPVNIQSIENPYYFRYKNNDRKWLTDLDWGILPNDPERIMGTTYDFFQ